MSCNEHKMYEYKYKNIINYKKISSYNICKLNTLRADKVVMYYQTQNYIDIECVHN